MARQLVTVRPPAVDFDHHDQSIADRIHDVYRDLRTSCPVEWSEHHGGFWVVTGYEEIHDIARNPQAFSVRAGMIPDTTGGQPLIPQMTDDPEHATYRALLQSWFTPKRIATFEPIVRSLAHDLIEALESPTDLASEFALPLPLNIILKVIGVQDNDLLQISEAVRYVIEHSGEDPAGARDSFQAAVAFVRDAVLAPLRSAPGDDLLSFLLTCRPNDEALTDDIIATIGFSIVGAGFDTTYKTLSSSLAYFAAHPEVQTAARSTPSANVVEEMLRLVAPVSGGRLVLDDIEVAGRQLQSGDRVLLAWPAANRDHAEFGEPDSPKFDRPSNRHMTFGTGIHRCLGMHLARLELRVAFEEIFGAFSDFHVQAGYRPTFSQSQVWGATFVPVEFSRA